MDLLSFEYYLQSEGLRASSISEHLKNVERCVVWAQEQEYSGIEHLTYIELLGYVQYQKSKKVSVQTINLRLNSLRKYYAHLKEEGYIESNPAKRLHIKGAVKKVINNPLKWSELENLYQSYSIYIDNQPVREARQHQIKLRNKAACSLLIGQGLHSGEIKKLEVSNIKLTSGTIEVSGTARSQSRELKLDSWQIVPLNNYLNSLSATQTSLFSTNVPNLILSVIRVLKGLNPVVEGAQHIRASVILHWLRLYGKRQTQYMIGHKWISSTEHYEVQELEGLTDMLKKYHPFSG